MSLKAALPNREAVQPSWRRHIIMIWLVGMFALLPVEMLKLPLNVTLVDVWTMAAMPLVWLSIPRGKQVISLYYAIPMWLILVGSFASIFAAPSPRNGLIVVLKEIFVFAWFITLSVALVRLNARDFRRVLVVWSAVVLLHGLVILAQFFSPALWQQMAGHLGRTAQYEFYRPSGFLSNANAAAFFQLLGFVPLALARLRRKVGAVLGLLLLITMLATGSMAAIISFTAGSLVAIVTLSVTGHIPAITSSLARLSIATVLIGAVLFAVIGQNERYQVHLQRILLGRAERSSEGRLDLWRRGADVFVEENVFLWGVGPENFRVVDGNNNQLHNDFLAFAVERGLVSTLGLGFFVVLILLRSLKLFLVSISPHGDHAQLVAIVLLAAFVAAFMYSLTHQVFHNRQLWLVLGLQEAMCFRLIRSRVNLGAQARAMGEQGRQRRPLPGSRVSAT